MSGLVIPFDWTIDESRNWPPRARPAAPYGSSLLEVMRECALRACFERSPGYERRMGFAARVGTAFHQTLRYLNEHPPIGRPAAEVMEYARQHFLRELSQQEAEMAKRPRERGLPRDEVRVDRALDAVITEALRINTEGPILHNQPGRAGSPERLGPEREKEDRTEKVSGQVEVPVRSKDAVFQGRVDRAEQTPEGTVLLDYKSALRDDLPERYERQLQFYAWLWNETFGEWPVQAQVIYPFTGTTHTVAVEPETCLHVIDDYRKVIAAVQHETVPIRLAKPGEVCQVCEFRPWCRAFWNWLSSESKIRPALERARFGFEGDLVEIRMVDHHWMLNLEWRNSRIKIVAPQERFPQLQRAEPRMHLRIADMELTGLMSEPQGRVTPISEIFIVR